MKNKSNGEITMAEFVEASPFVSVIMPVYNEARFVEKAVRSFLDNDYTDDRMEIVVIDGMSNDGTRDVLQDIAGRESRLRVVDNPQKFTPISMNLGIQASRGDVIVVVGAHSEFANNYLSRCVDVLQRTGAGCAGGYMETLPGGSGAVAQAISAATSSPFGVGGGKFRTGGTSEQEVDTVAFGAFRREVYESVGLYHPLLIRNQDMEFSTRMRKAGYKIIISPDIHFTYYNRGTYRGLRQQAFNNGLWNPYTLYLVGGGLRLRHFIPMGFVLSILTGIGLGFLWWPFWALLGVEIACYLLAAVWFSCKAGNKQNANPILVLFAFIQLHLSYGIGSLWGVLSAPFKFGLRPRKNSGIPLLAPRDG